MFVARLEETGDGLLCERCRLIHPVVDGIPIVLRNLDEWLAQEIVNVVSRRDLPASLVERLSVSAGGPFRRSHLRLTMYLGCLEGPLQAWVRERVARLSGSIVDLCCGIGTHGRLDVLGVDVDWILLREFPGPRLLADAMDPPFVGGSFDNVLLLGAVDAVRNPFLLLRQADAILRPGGRLLLTTPFAWRDEVTPPRAWIDEGTLLGFLRQQGYAMEVGRQDWLLRPDPRTTVVHHCLTVEATKPG